MTPYQDAYLAVEISIWDRLQVLGSLYPQVGETLKRPPGTVTLDLCGTF